MKKFICMTGILFMCILISSSALNAQTLGQENLFLKSGFWPIDTAMDSTHNHYGVGSFWGTVVFGRDTLVSNGALDIFIVKYGPDGKLAWAIKEGGKKNDAGFGLCVDASGNVYVTGYFSDNVSFGFGTAYLTNKGGYDTFVAKYGPSGNLLWVKRQGGSGFDAGYDITADKSGNVYVTGFFSDTLTLGGVQHPSAGKRDFLVAKYDKNGTLLWITQGGGAQDDYGHTISIDNAGNIVVEGIFTDQASFNGKYVDGDLLGPNSFRAVYDTNGNLRSASLGDPN